LGTDEPLRRRRSAEPSAEDLARRAVRDGQPAGVMTEEEVYAELERVLSTRRITA
jgi:hypothetical protein